MAGYQADTSPFAIDGSHIKWAWLLSLAVHIGVGTMEAPGAGASVCFRIVI